MGYVDLSIVYVGYEDFTQDDYNKIGYAVNQFVPWVYDKVGHNVGNVSYWQISNRQWSSTIDKSDAGALTEQYSISSGGVDVFVVLSLIGAAGISALNGSCEKTEAGWTGAVVSLRDYDYYFVGNTFAHEIGHYLGLKHYDERGNFMHSASEDWGGIYPWQGEIMYQHCFVYD
jgi:hypothetical protein